MIIIVLIAVTYLIYIDAVALHRQDEALYKKTIQYDPRLWALFSFLFFAAVTPVYLLRKQQFRKIFVESDNRFSPQASPSEFLVRSDAYGIVIAWAVFTALFAISIAALSYLQPIFKSKLGELVLLTAFSSVMMAILIYGRTRQHPYEGFLTSVGLRKSRKSFWQAGILPLMGGVGFACLSSFFIMFRSAMPTTPLYKILEAPHSTWALLAFLGLAMLIGPLLEEIIFRGYFFSVVRTLKGTRFAIFSIAAIFAFLHIGQYWGDWVAIAAVATLGLSLTALRAWTNSTISSVIMHYAYNGFVTIIPVFMLVFANPSHFLYRLSYDKLDAETKEELLIDSIRENPDNAEAYNDLAWLYAKENKNLDDALALAEEALAYEPQNAAFLDTKAEVLYQLGYFKEAVTIEEWIVKDNPSDRFFQEQLKKFKNALMRQELQKDGAPELEA